jgi:hypothetical protein
MDNKYKKKKKNIYEIYLSQQTERLKLLEII